MNCPQPLIQQPNQAVEGWLITQVFQTGDLTWLECPSGSGREKHIPSKADATSKRRGTLGRVRGIGCSVISPLVTRSFRLIVKNREEHE